MAKSLVEIALQLKNANKKVQLIYAFNGVGKTRLSREFRELVAQKDDNEDLSEPARNKIIYYNAFTEDLFYWDNDLDGDNEPKLKIQPNSFTNWILETQGQDQSIIATFQRYTNDKLMPHFNEEYKSSNRDNREITVRSFSEVRFSLKRGDDSDSGYLKISKGEESNFIWSVFYALLEQIIEVLNVLDPEDRETRDFDNLEYIFIDDPVSSLDENHLIELAVDLATLIKSSKSEKLKFIITTHNPLFYNVLHNELKKAGKYRMSRQDDGSYELNPQSDDSPFSYHLHLKSELEKAIANGQLKKYHFNFFRNILEKTATFLGYENWGDLLPKTDEGKPNLYETRIINISSHSKHSSEEVSDLTDDDKRILRFLVKQINDTYHFRQSANTQNKR